MPLNLLKKYPELLEIGHLPIEKRNVSLRGIFCRDIEENAQFSFKQKKIYPIKGQEPEMQLLFRHLTTHEIEERVETGEVISKREFEHERSVRLHWVKHHVECKKTTNMEIFSVMDRVKEQNVIRTYILDKDQQYVIILEPQRTKTDYYLLTAYHLQPRNFKKIKNKAKRKLPDLH